MLILCLEFRAAFPTLMHPEPVIRVSPYLLLESCRDALGDPEDILFQVAAEAVQREDFEGGPDRTVRLMVGKGRDQWGSCFQVEIGGPLGRQGGSAEEVDPDAPLSFEALISRNPDEHVLSESFQNSPDRGAERNALAPRSSPDPVDEVIHPFVLLCSNDGTSWEAIGAKPEVKELPVPEMGGHDDSPLTFFEHAGQ